MNAHWLLVSSNWKHLNTHTLRVCFHTNQHLSRADSWIWLRVARLKSPLRTHGGQTQNCLRTVAASSSPGRGRKVGRVALLLCVFEKRMSIGETIGLSPMPPRASATLSAGEEKHNGSRRENPQQIIIHGEEDFPSGKLFPTRQASLSALTSANQRAGVQVSL